jgi:hypothetical protein
MWSSIGKVIGSPSLHHTTYTSADLVPHICVAPTTKLEAANMALAEESAALTWDVQSIWASADILKEELTTMLVALDELVVWECEAEIKLQNLYHTQKIQI